MKKSFINSSIGILCYIASFLPMFILRKVFLEYLGPEYLGLNSLYNNIIGYLSIIEMGIGSAIIYCLYKPFAQSDKVKLKGYLSYYEKFYKKAGICILGIGILITPFIHIFISDDINLNVIRVGFLLFLINTLLGYMFTYKHCLLIVAQEGYKVSLSISISKVFIAFCQVVVIKLYKNFYLFIITQILINFITYIILNYYIDERFSWVKEGNGSIDEFEKENLIKNLKALFFHRIGSIFVLGTDNIVISTFLSLSTVTLYNNYVLITNSFSGIMGQIMGGMTASVGNLLVEKDKNYSYQIHKKLFFMNSWIVSFFVISLINTINQFIFLWLGNEYILDWVSLSLILFNLYFQLMRAPVDRFKDASGEYYKDRYAPIFEGGINLIFSITLVNLIGLPGIFIGTLMSNLLVVFWVKPFIVYKYVFNKPLMNYFKMYFKYLSIAFIPLLLTMFLTLDLKQNITIEAFIINCLINIVVINLFYLIVFWKNENFIYFKNIALNLIKRTKKPEQVC